MASSLVFLILCAAYTATSSAQKNSNISPGSSLAPTSYSSSWPSPSGLYAFGFYEYGSGYAVGVFVAGIPERTVVWTANRDNPPVSGHVTLNFTTDGRFILQSPQGQITSIANISQVASSASMLDTGNFVLYNSQRDVVWQSFSHPTDTILHGQILSEGQALISHASDTDYSTGRFCLLMQGDSDLVQYPLDCPQFPSSCAYWATGTYMEGENITLNLDDDGHLYLLNGDMINIRNISPGEITKDKKIYMLKLDVDGIFRVYSRALDDLKSNWSILWNSSNDKCDPKGLCGFYGYCVVTDLEAQCKCLPGFDFVQPGNWTSGCGRNLSLEGCKNANHTMEALENTTWENNPYSVIQNSTREDCQEACLLDCNCEVALFQGGQCNKQRLPLRYGRRTLGDSPVTFIKQNQVAPSTNEAPPPGVVLDKHPGKEGTTKMILLCDLQ